MQDLGMTGSQTGPGPLLSSPLPGSWTLNPFHFSQRLVLLAQQDPKGWPQHRSEAFLVSGSYDIFIPCRNAVFQFNPPERTCQNTVRSKGLLNKTPTFDTLIFNSRKLYQPVVGKELIRILPPLPAWTGSVQAVLKPSLHSRPLQKHSAVIY